MKSSHLKFLFFMLLLCAAAPLFAQGIVPSGLNNVSSQLEEAFTGPIVRVILVCCFIGCGVAYAFNKDNEKAKRNIIAVGAGIIIIGAASGVVEVMMNAAKS
jgi:type IV secretory pathway VirB2 component (pilin)